MIINCWNENEKCDDCGNSPVQFIVDNIDDPDKIERFCVECFSKRQQRGDETKTK